MMCGKLRACFNLVNSHSDNWAGGVESGDPVRRPRGPRALRPAGRTTPGHRRSRRPTGPRSRRRCTGSSGRWPRTTSSSQDPSSGRYQLGPAVLRLGNVYLDTLELRSRAMSWSEELARRTGMAVRTGVLAGDDVVIIHHEPRPDGSRQMPEIGIIIPATPARWARRNARPSCPARPSAYWPRRTAA